MGSSCTREGNHSGVNFAVFSAHAHAMELCIFDATGVHELQRIHFPARSGDVWHLHLDGASGGLVYGLRAHGPWLPEVGHRFNPNKLLLDPCARDIVGHFEWREEHFASNDLDNATHALKARVIDDVQEQAFDWAGDAAPRTALADTVLYELHVKGFTALHQEVPAPLRGTYAGLASPAAIGHLKRLGITAVSLLPVHQHLDEQRLTALGLSNYWGYNTIGFFAVEPSYAASLRGQSPRDEFRSMVRGLHAAGIEVILDVVFNHTAESDADGPHLSWRGLDNRSYYRTLPDQPGVLDNLTGCGNALDLRHPCVLRQVMDSLRYWVSAMHVDGFRFDLAPVLGRGDHGFDARAAFFQAVAQDPLLQSVKMIAEPWDIGPGGYQLGQFPTGWLEWNDRFRDTVRGHWLGHETDQGADRGELAQRLTASAELFNHLHREPAASVNFITAHDGFTLRDLVSYNIKHNDANGENNRDGHGHNLSWNCGEEGDSHNPQVLSRRAALQRALLATLMLSQGTPMLCAGDELGHSQGGNNNPYCQDNATTWIDWSMADENLIAFTVLLIQLRRGWLPMANRWLLGEADAQGVHELLWLRGDGQQMQRDDWRDPHPGVLGALIGKPGKQLDAQHSALLLLINADAADRGFQLPMQGWQVLMDSHLEHASAAGSALSKQAMLAGRSMVLLRSLG
jgi:glycogen debranching enzyme